MFGVIEQKYDGYLDSGGLWPGMGGVSLRGYEGLGCAVGRLVATWPGRL